MSEFIEGTTVNLKGEFQFSFISLTYKNVSFIAYFVSPNTDTHISHNITMTGTGEVNDADHLVNRSSLDQHNVWLRNLQYLELMWKSPTPSWQCPPGTLPH